MKQSLTCFLAVLVVGGCAVTGSMDTASDMNNGISDNGQIRPMARPATLNTTIKAPPVAARTVEEFDTTTAEQRSEAVAEASTGGEKALGVTVASLGSPTEPGFWLKTPLVSAPSRARWSMQQQANLWPLI